MEVEFLLGRIDREEGDGWFRGLRGRLDKLLSPSCRIFCFLKLSSIYSTDFSE